MVVPIVGQDLLTVSIEGLQTPLYPWLATRLANALDVSAADLPSGEELAEVARRHLAKPQEAQDIYRELRTVFRDLEPIATPKPLSQLAKMTRFKLYVTTTFDLMAERAIDEERFSGQRQTLVFSYAPNDKQDLPREFNRLNRPAVFHLMGRLSGTPGSYAVTREDTLEFVNSLDVKAEDSPHFLFDKLRSSNLLIIGSHLADWLARFFVRNIKGRTSHRNASRDERRKSQPNGNPRGPSALSSAFQRRHQNLAARRRGRGLRRRALPALDRTATGGGAGGSSRYRRAHSNTWHASGGSLSEPRA